MANLCQLLGYARNDTAKLTRIMNANVRHERGGKTYNMGDALAREIERKLGLERGWMDNPENAYLKALEDPSIMAAALSMQQGSAELRPAIARMVAAAVEPIATTDPAQKHG